VLDGEALLPDHVGGPHGLLAFIDASSSPYHAVRSATERLAGRGFVVLDEAEAWPTAPGRYVVGRGGSLVAWQIKPDADPLRGFRLIGAHTDSPNLRIKPRPDTGGSGCRQLAVEVYGGVLLNSWLDRDLGVSGRVTVRDGRHPTTRLLRVDRPLLRIPQLAIHLDRGVNEHGLKLDAQQQLLPVWGLGAVDEGSFRRFVAKELGVADDAVLSWDVMAHDLTPSRLLGADDEFVSAPRIDNLASCHSAIEALVSQLDDEHWGDELPGIPVVCLYDHEEIGSQSATGADGAMLASVLERITTSAGLDREGFHRALAVSRCVSADGAHATHPNYPERHDPVHPIRIGGGPVLKVNANMRYATDAESAATFELACDTAGVPLQRFVARNDMPCGSTIGPVTAARLGVPTVDVGIPQLAMHSARELCGATDPALFTAVLSTFLVSS
jgi:aspartyl aminopeptidase